MVSTTTIALLRLHLLVNQPEGVLRKGSKDIPHNKALEDIPDGQEDNPN